MSFEFLKKHFGRFLTLNFTNKFIITYFLSWMGLFGTLTVSKLLKPLFNVETAGKITVVKYEAISSAVSSQMGINYYSIGISYFLSNYLACITIFLAFSILSYLYKKDISKGKSTLNDYFNSILLFYVIVVINPLTGVLGVNIPFSDLLAVIPHGIFEYAGFSLSIVLGIEYTLYKLPISKPFESWDNKKKILFLIKLILVPLLILISGFTETLDWLILNYAKENNLPILETFFNVYYSILKSIIL
ncbi:conserved hypothetical protein [Methanococcus vannielii SB]|uniref:Uncharacterized protein n=1 Tax=Methanococcus vannielii (strain ATCC 35089 / DSM 1224 / JCM 13029 / OCM 148 / SB) TaxID=406327 RepID=A6UQC0_METVS|nr:hypothetical protein [Methanococcus vannielii]ABR54692.1 conserved hypothetical protein [Methanococcus vannielii SB]